MEPTRTPPHSPLPGNVAPARAAELLPAFLEFLESRGEISRITQMARDAGALSEADLDVRDVTIATLHERVAHLEAERAAQDQALSDLSARNTESERRLAELSSAPYADLPEAGQDHERAMPTDAPPPPWTAAPGEMAKVKGLIRDFERSDRPWRQRAITGAKFYLGATALAMVAPLMPIPTGTYVVVAGGAIAASEAWMRYMPARQIRRAMERLEALSAALPDASPESAADIMKQSAITAQVVARSHARARAYREHGFVGRMRLVRSKVRLALTINRNPETRSPGATRAAEEVAMHDAIVANHVDDFLAQHALASLDDAELARFRAAALGQTAPDIDIT